jgi:hypothetical protein
MPSFQGLMNVSVRLFIHKDDSRNAKKEGDPEMDPPLIFKTVIPARLSLQSKQLKKGKCNDSTSH